MPYCVNCGKDYEKQPSICMNCFLDPAILEVRVDQKLHQLAFSNFGSGGDFSYFGERTCLALSVTILAILAFIIGTISFGLFFVMVVLALVNLKISNIRSRGSMIRLSADNFPDLYRLMKVVCYRLKVPLLPVYIHQEREYNAYTQGFLRDAWVVLNSELVEDFTPLELTFVLGHEAAHVKRRHTTWLTLMSPASNISTALVSGIVRTVFNFWSLKCEHTADRGGLLAVRDFDAAISALLKLAAGLQMAAKTDWKKLIAEHEEKDSILLKATELLGTHPFPVRRIKEVYEFSRTEKYRSLLRDRQ